MRCTAFCPTPRYIAHSFVATGRAVSWYSTVTSRSMAERSTAIAAPAEGASRPRRLRGRAFYESIGSPKLILAPMVDQSEFAWRMLSRSYLKEEDRSSLLAYTPMFHARLFGETQSFRDKHFQPVRSGLETALAPEDVPAKKHDFLDGRPGLDRPLTVQFCANDPQELLRAARYVQPYCDAVDLNLGCPQGIARKGHYGAFLQEDWELVSRIISTLNENLEVPVTAKIRVLETREKTLEYARRIVDAGASILTVHGRLREQKGHMTGLADWSTIRYLRDNIPKELVMFANGNILRNEDIQKCLDATGVDGVMSAEGNLSDPTIFAEPPLVGKEGREYWRGRDGRGGFRMDAVFRKYMDIIHKYVLEKPAPERKPLFMLSDHREPEEVSEAGDQAKANPAKRNVDVDEGEARPKKRRKGDGKKTKDPNLTAMQAHLFNLLRPLIAVHTDVRDALARSRSGDVEAFENVLAMTEEAVKKGLLEYEKEPGKFEEETTSKVGQEQATKDETADIFDSESSMAAVKACKRPYWVCQPYVRPLPKEAMAKGAISVSKKELKKQQEQSGLSDSPRKPPDGTGNLESAREQLDAADGMKREDIPKEAMVAG